MTGEPQQSQPDGAEPPVPEVVEPLGAHEAPPEVGAVDAWDWRSGSTIGGAVGGAAPVPTWEPAPFATFAAAAAPTPSTEPSAAAEPVPPAEPIAAIPGAIAPEAAEGVQPEAPLPDPTGSWWGAADR